MSGDFAIPYGYSRERQTFLNYLQDRHLLTFGPTRSGKGATVIVQALLRVPHSVICVDPKGQNAAITARQRRALGQEVFLLNPFGLHTGPPWKLPKHRFNPLAHLRIDDNNVVADVGGLAEALIISEGREPFFTDAARDLVKAIILHLIETRGGAATLTEMRRLLTLPRADKPDADVFLQHVLTPMMQSKLPFVRQPAMRFIDNNRTVQSVLAVAATQTGFLDDPSIAATLSGSDFRMGDLKHRPATVYLILPGRYIEAYSQFFRLLITSAIDQLTAEPGGHPTLMLLDEFATLQNLGAISKAFGFAAGFNLQCWAFLQDMPQLQALYGQKWESFVANAGLLQFFTPADMTTAEYLQRRGGLTIIENTSRQTSPYVGAPRGMTYSESREPLLPPERTMSMQGHEQLVFFGGTHRAHEVEREFYKKIERLDGLYDKDPYH